MQLPLAQWTCKRFTDEHGVGWRIECSITLPGIGRAWQAFNLNEKFVRFCGEGGTVDVIEQYAKKTHQRTISRAESHLRNRGIK